jgi:hypothetical protein
LQNLIFGTHKQILEFDRKISPGFRVCSGDDNIK